MRIVGDTTYVSLADLRRNRGRISLDIKAKIENPQSGICPELMVDDRRLDSNLPIAPFWGPQIVYFRPAPVNNPVKTTVSIEVPPSVNSPFIDNFKVGVYFKERTPPNWRPPFTTRREVRFWIVVHQ
jgi:hypothetical protein